MEDYLQLSSLYYDVSKPIGTSLDGDLEFYLSHIKDSQKVLEAGVGTGRLLIPFLKEGVNIEGLDYSKEMLEICRVKCLEHQVSTKLMQGSVEDYNFDNDYDAIIIPTGTFCLFPNIKTVLENFKNSLSDGGFILFDLIYPTTFKEGESFMYPLVINDHQKILLTDHHSSIDWTHQKTMEHLVYDLWTNGTLEKSELQTFIINWYGLNEMKMILSELGFKDVEVYGNYKPLNDHESYDTLTIKAYK